MTDTVTTGKRGRKISPILTDRLCETRVDNRTKTYDRKCQGLYVSITTAGVATFNYKFTSPETGKQRTAWLGVFNPETFTVENARSKVYGLKAKGGTAIAECKKELNAGLMRELDEKKALLMPCVIDDCEIPLFLREKLYADFRFDPDKALSDVDRALSKISNPLQGRSETPDFHIDWSTSWGTIGDDVDLQFIELTFVDHADRWPYSVMSQCRMMCNPAASKSFLKSIKNGKREEYIRDALGLVLKKLKRPRMTMLIDSSLPQKRLEKIQINKREDVLVEFSCRRMGSDNGMDTLYHMDGNLHRALDHMNETLHRPKSTQHVSGNYSR